MAWNEAGSVGLATCHAQKIKKRESCMRKALVHVLMMSMLIAAAAAAAADGNLQTIHPVNSELYEAIRSLHVSQGLALPSTAGPWSSDELLGMLDHLDRSRMSPAERRLYDQALQALSGAASQFRFNVTASAEGYWHANTTSFTRESDWIYNFKQREPFLDIVLETWPADGFYGYSSLSAGNTRYHDFGSGGASSLLFGATSFATNIWMVPPSTLGDLDFNIPYRAFGAFGGRGWSVQVGRDTLSWGPGESGNFIIGDHLLYHNTGRFTAYGRNFKYTLATLFFPHPQNYYPVTDGSGNFINNGWQATPMSGLNMFLGHRLEWRLFGGKAGLAVSEAIMYQSKDSTLDLQILNPSMIYHDLYIRGNSNSIISVEADVSPIRHLNLYGQVVVDEFALPGEPVPGKDAGALPSAYGFMAGMKTALPLGKGMLTGSMEWAKTDPYLYLRDDGNYEQAPGEYGLNWVVAIREYAPGTGITYTEDFLGYRYGGDAIVYQAKAGYQALGSWRVGLTLFHMIHGTHDKWTLWTNADEGRYPGSTTFIGQSTPTTVHHTGNNADPNAGLRDSTTRTTVVSLSGSWKISKALKTYGEIDYIHILNPGNRSSAAPITDVQVSAGVAVSF